MPTNTEPLYYAAGGPRGLLHRLPTPDSFAAFCGYRPLRDWFVCQPTIPGQWRTFCRECAHKAARPRRATGGGVMRAHVETFQSAPLCARCSEKWPCDGNELEDRLQDATDERTVALDALALALVERDQLVTGCNQLRTELAAARAERDAMATTIEGVQARCASFAQGWIEARPTPSTERGSVGGELMAVVDGLAAALAPTGATDDAG